MKKKKKPVYFLKAVICWPRSCLLGPLTSLSFCNSWVYPAGTML